MSCQSESSDGPIKKVEIIGTQCSKCKEKSAVFIFRRNPNCWECMELAMKKKFTPALIKARESKQTTLDILCAVSGGLKSMSLLHMLHLQANTMRRRISMELSAVFIDEGAVLGLDYQKRMANRAEMTRILEQYPYDFWIVSLEDVYNLDQLCDVELLEDDERTEKLKAAFNEITTLTSKEDLLTSLKRNIFLGMAKKFGIKHVTTGETSTNMAIRLMSSTSKGRGINLRNELSYVELLENYGELPIRFVRPLKEFLDEEIAFYHHKYRVQTVAIPSLSFTVARSQYKSLNGLCEGFITMLQHDFPHTVHTVVRAGTKLKPARDHKIEYCTLCTSVLEIEDENLCYSCRILQTEFKHENTELFQVSTNIMTNQINKEAIRKEIEMSMWIADD